MNNHHRFATSAILLLALATLPASAQLQEPDETFLLEITGTTNVAFEPGRSATATIIDQPPG